MENKPLQQIELARLKDRIEAARHRESRTKHVNEYQRLMDAKFYGRAGLLTVHRQPGQRPILGRNPSLAQIHQRRQRRPQPGSAALATP